MHNANISFERCAGIEEELTDKSHSGAGKLSTIIGTHPLLGAVCLIICHTGIEDRFTLVSENPSS